MSDLIDFHYYKKKQILKKQEGNKNLTLKIYMTTVELINQNMLDPFINPMEHITTNTELSVLFKGDDSRLNQAFWDLKRYWAIEDPSVLSISFEEFRTVSHLCYFIEKRVKL